MSAVPNNVTNGKVNNLNELQQWSENIKEMHGRTVGESKVAVNYFVTPTPMDATYKVQGR